MKAQHSMVIVGPNAQIQNFEDTVGVAFGYSFGFGRTDIRPDTPGTGPGTHSGLHGWVDSEFKDFMTETTVKSTEELAALGLTQGDVSSALSSCTVSFDPVVDEGLETERTLSKREHFNEVLTDANLHTIPEEI